MIESCNTKRMLLATICLGGLTLVVLIVESHWTGQTSNRVNAVDNSSKPEHCWQTESFIVVKACEPCSQFEITSKTVEACIPTHFKEIIKCQHSGTTQRSCQKVTWIEEKRFWIFEAVMFALAVLSCSAVQLRQRVLDHRIIQRIQKQLANGLAN